MDSTRELVNSVIWPGFEGTAAPSWLIDELEHGLAGTVYFSNNLTSVATAAELSAALRRANPYALIGLDEEGGTVTRLQSQQGSTITGAGLLGAINDTALTSRASGLIAEQCHLAGVNVVLAPVADVNVNPLNPVIGVRSFGADPELVSAHIGAAVSAFNSKGVASCAKHFPGHGDTTADSHLALPISGADAATQESVHLAPFRAAVEAGVPAVMSAHVVLPHLGDEPATLNPQALQTLRGLGFDGVIVSDALDMAAIAKTHGIGHGGVLALAAGVDLLCVGNPTNVDDPGLDRAQFTELHEAIVGALADGSLPVERLEEASQRVRALAVRFAVKTPDSAPEKDPGPLPSRHRDRFDPELLTAVQELLTSQSPPPLELDRPVQVLDLRHRTNMAAGISQDRFTGALEAQGVTCSYARLRPDGAIPATRPNEQLLVLADDLSLHNWQAATVNWLHPHVVVNAGVVNAQVVNAQVAPPAGGPSTINAPVLNCYESSAISAVALAAVLTRRHHHR